MTAIAHRLARQPPGDLDRLAGQLETGQLALTPSSLALAGFAHPAEIAADLADLAAAGFAPGAAAVLLRSMAAAHRHAAEAAGTIDLVVTGPDTPGAARDTAVVMEELFGMAEHSVLVVGFALHDGASILAPLAKRMVAVPDLDVMLCLNISRDAGSTTKESDILARFAAEFLKDDWPWKPVPKVYYDPRALAPNPSARAVLHAKAIVVDGRRALVTSANLTSAAQKKNIELGLLITNRAAARAVRRHFRSLVTGGLLRRLSV